MAKVNDSGSSTVPAANTNPLQSHIDVLTKAKSALLERMVSHKDSKAGAKANSIDSEIASLTRIGKRLSEDYYNA